MKVFYFSLSTSAIILNSVDLGSQFECLPNGEPIPGIPLSRPSNFSDATNLPLESTFSADPSFRHRLKSPSGMRYTTSRTRTTLERLPMGFSLQQLRYIRLIPVENPSRIFELRKYTFPPGEPLKLFIATNQYEPIPAKEQIVLSTSDSDIFAILESQNVLIGIYHKRTKKRSKMNMASGMITSLTPKEVKEIVVGRTRTVQMHYRIERVEAQSSTT